MKSHSKPRGLYGLVIFSETDDVSRPLKRPLARGWDNTVLRSSLFFNAVLMYVILCFLDVMLFIFNFDACFTHFSTLAPKSGAKHQFEMVPSSMLTKQSCHVT